MELAAVFSALFAQFLEFAGACEPRERDVLLAGGGIVMTSVLPTVEAALAISAESRTGLVIESAEPEVTYLRGSSSESPESRGIAAFRNIPAARLPIRRHAQVTRWWTPVWRVPSHLMRPDIVAISENSLLVSSAQSSNARIGFRHGGNILRRVRGGYSGVRHQVDVMSLADTFVRRILEIPGLIEPIRSRLRDVLMTHVSTCFEFAAKDLAALARYPRLPNAIWSGTGGTYAGRAIGLEVLKRGGTVVRFDHGGTVPMIDAPAIVSFIELSVSSKFVVATNALASTLRFTKPNGPTASWHVSEIDGEIGDPSMRGLALDAPRRGAQRRRVLYVPMFLRGFSKHALYPFTDPVYLDWQLRLADVLLQMPVDLLCKPHPDGVLKDRRHPLSLVAKCSNASFESEMADADVFVFDRCTSTTFWRAVCTNRPVILVRLGPPGFNEPASMVLERRCKILEVTYDENNLPHVDTNELREAVLGGPDRTDPSEIRELILGRFAP